MRNDGRDDVVWSPCKFKSLELVAALNVVIVVVFRLVMTVAVDGIHGDWTIFD